jgi:hypothetical protein
MLFLTRLEQYSQHPDRQANERLLLILWITCACKSEAFIGESIPGIILFQTRNVTADSYQLATGNPLTC